MTWQSHTHKHTSIHPSIHLTCTTTTIFIQEMALWLYFISSSIYIIQGFILLQFFHIKQGHQLVDHSPGADLRSISTNETGYLKRKRKKKTPHTNYKQVLLCSRTFTNLSWKPLPQSINTAHLHTFAAVWRDTVSAGGHCNLHNSRGCHHSPVMIIMESNTSVLCWGKNSAGHHLCSLLNLIENTQSTLRRRSQETV